MPKIEKNFLTVYKLLLFRREERKKKNVWFGLVC